MCEKEKITEDEKEKITEDEKEKITEDEKEKITEDEKEKITEEMKVHEKWYEEAKTVTLENLNNFIKKLLGYSHDYGTICHALTAGAISTITAMNNGSEQGSITVFQAGCIMREFIWRWMGIKGAIKLVKYDNMLYPQYEYQFEKTIKKDIFEGLQKQAKEELTKTKMHPKVREHMEGIVNGVIPFGYKIKEE